MLLRLITLRSRLLLTMAIVAASLCALGAWGVLANQLGTQRVSALFDEAQSTNDAVARLRESLSNLRRLQANVVAVGTSNSNEVERLIGLWKAEAAAVRSHGVALAKIDPDNAALATLVKTQQGQLAAYNSAIGPIAEQLQQAKIDAAVALAYAERAEGTATALVQSADDMLKAVQARQVQIRESMAASSAFVSKLRLVLVAVTLAVVMPLLWLTLHSVCQPLEQAVAVAERIAQGDLSEEIHSQGRDETAALLRSLQRMQQSLRDLVGQVRDSAH